MLRRAIIVAALVTVVALAIVNFTLREDNRPGQPSPHAIDQSQ
ncbi:hypothetical protein [Agrobacterium sp. SORGH_AS 787]|nr:hypothetical protein [Rhizobium sp. SORGH_AS_0787]